MEIMIKDFSLVEVTDPRSLNLNIFPCPTRPNSRGQALQLQTNN